MVLIDAQLLYLSNALQKFGIGKEILKILDSKSLKYEMNGKFSHVLTTTLYSAEPTKKTMIQNNEVKNTTKSSSKIPTTACSLFYYFRMKHWLLI